MPAFDSPVSPPSTGSFNTPPTSPARQFVSKSVPSVEGERHWRLSGASKGPEPGKIMRAGRPSVQSSEGVGRGGSTGAGGGVDKYNLKAMIPQFDPRALLNPKATAKRAPDKESENETEKKAIGIGMGAMLERMHNVEVRQRNPQKKRKVEAQSKEDKDEEQEQLEKKKSTFEGGGSGTVLGEYVKKKQEEGDRERVGQESSIVDLTADDDDGEPDIVVLRDTGEREVCLGKVDTASVIAFQVPAPKSTGFKGTDRHWPVMKVTLNRRLFAGRDIVVAVRDPCGNEFGRLDPKIAVALVPLMDAVATNRIRVVARLEMRKKEPNENPRKPISKKLSLNVTLFAPRKFAESIGKYLGQRQVFLRNPTFTEKVELFNPHAPPVPTLQIRAPNSSYSNGAGGGTGYVTRTVEEVRHDVMCMFDALTKTEDLAEQDQDPQIMTPLLKHQKQALHFLLHRETEVEVQEDEGDKFSLWRLRTARNGKRTYYNVITGKISSFLLSARIRTELKRERT